MKKLIYLSLFLTLFLGQNFIFAQVVPPGSYQPPEIPTQFFSCQPTDSLRVCILRLLDDALKVILVIALAGAAIFIAWAGLLYLTKGPGEPGKSGPKDKIIYAAVGLAIAFLAWVMTVILSRIISGGSQAI